MGEPQGLGQGDGVRMIAHGVFKVVEWNLLPVPLLVPVHLLVSSELVVVAFACSDPHWYSEKELTARPGLPISVVALEVVKKAPKGEIPTSLSWS